MTAETIGRALHGRKSGLSWMAKCPAHDDSSPSLALKDSGGKVLIQCHAGCKSDDVIAVLRQRGLWETGQRSDGPWDYPSRIVATYDYVDERGQLLYKVTRHEPTPEDKKPFRPWHVDSNGKWRMGKHARQVLYHLPEVLKAPIVFLVEGEKDAGTLRSHGFVATTKAGGAKSGWEPGYTEALTGREVILIPDNDEPGRALAVKVARALFGRVRRLVILELDGGKDVTDWFNAGHGQEELVQLIERKAPVIQ